MKDYEKWFKKADSDLKTVVILLNAEDCLPDICCFHSQQCAEKYLKAYLVSRNIKFPKTHDLEVLLNLLIKQNEIFIQLMESIIPLQEFGIAPRYPDDIDELTSEDAKIALSSATSIKEFILKNFFI